MHLNVAEKDYQRPVMVASLVIAFLMLGGKTAAWYITGSAAILSDALESVGVIVGCTLIILYEWLFVDAIVTIVIAVYILGHAAIEIPKAIHILMQGVPAGLDVTDVTASLQDVPGVRDVHHVHIWHIDEHRRSLEAHVVIDAVDMASMETIKMELKQRLADRFEIGHSTLEFEFSEGGEPSDDQPLGAVELGR